MDDQNDKGQANGGVAMRMVMTMWCNTMVLWDTLNPSLTSFVRILWFYVILYTLDDGMTLSPTFYVGQEFFFSLILLCGPLVFA